jgi:hypothetical protein
VGTATAGIRQNVVSCNGDLPCAAREHHINRCGGKFSQGRLRRFVERSAVRHEDLSTLRSSIAWNARADHCMERHAALSS